MPTSYSRQPCRMGVSSSRKMARKSTRCSRGSGTAHSMRIPSITVCKRACNADSARDCYSTLGTHFRRALMTAPSSSPTARRQIISHFRSTVIRDSTVGFPAMTYATISSLAEFGRSPRLPRRAGSIYSAVGKRVGSPATPPGCQCLRDFPATQPAPGPLVRTIARDSAPILLPAPATTP